MIHDLDKERQRVPNQLHMQRQMHPFPNKAQDLRNQRCGLHPQQRKIFSTMCAAFPNNARSSRRSICAAPPTKIFSTIHMCCIPYTLIGDSICLLCCIVCLLFGGSVIVGCFQGVLIRHAFTFLFVCIRHCELFLAPFYFRQSILRHTPSHCPPQN